MGRHRVKKAICYLYWILMIISAYIYHFFKVSLYSAAEIVIYAVSLFSLGLNEKLVFYSPSLGKPVYHISGTYYIEVVDAADKYVLCKDHIFKKEVLKEYDACYIKDANELCKSVKEQLDYLYDKQVKNRKKHIILENWDGYTSIDIKRDKKIDVII